MSQQPQPSNLSAPPTVEELRRECFALIWSISRHPYSLKLLLKARLALNMFAAYKR